MIDTQRQQCLEEAQLENETTGGSGVSGGVPSPLMSRAQFQACGSHNSQMGIKGTGHTPELWASDTAEGKATTLSWPLPHLGSSQLFSGNCL